MSREGDGRSWRKIKISKGKSVNLKPQTWNQLEVSWQTVKNQYKKDVIFNNSEIKYAVNMLGIGAGEEKSEEKCSLLAIIVHARTSLEESLSPSQGSTLGFSLSTVPFKASAWQPPSTAGVSALSAVQNSTYQRFLWVINPDSFSPKKLGLWKILLINPWSLHK